MALAVTASKQIPQMGILHADATDLRSYTGGVTQSSIGLCTACSWARRVENGRGSTFLRCGRYDVDRRFPKYPPLPMTSCIGFDPPPPGLTLDQLGQQKDV